MSEYNFVVINRAGQAKPASLSFLLVNLGMPWTLPTVFISALAELPKCVVVSFFRRGLPHKK